MNTLGWRYAHQRVKIPGGFLVVLEKKREQMPLTIHYCEPAGTHARYPEDHPYPVIWRYSIVKRREIRQWRDAGSVPAVP